MVTDANWKSFWPPHDLSYFEDIMRPIRRSDWHWFLQCIPIWYFSTRLVFGLAPVLFAAPGDIDTTFDAKLDGPVTQFSIAPDGKIVVYGGFTTVHGVARPGLARLLPDGRLDENFAPAKQTNTVIIAAVALGDQRVVLAISNYIPGNTTNRLVALSPSGAQEAVLDFSAVLTAAGFSTFRINSSIAILLLPDGTPLVRASQAASDWPGTKLAYFALRLAGNTISATLTNFVEDPFMLRQSTGKIITTQHERVDFYHQSSVFLRRFGGDVIDPSFSVALSQSYLKQVAVQPDDRLLIAATPFNLPSDPPPVTALARFEADGMPDPTFPPIGFGPQSRFDNQVFKIEVLPGNKALVASGFTSIGGATRAYLARVDLGPINTPKPPRIISGPESLEVLVGQEATFRVNPDAIGPLSYQWYFRNNPLIGLTNATLVVTNVAFAEGDYAVEVKNSAGAVRSSPAHLTIIPAVSGAVDPNFNPGSGTDDGQVNALLREPDGRILVGGTFTRFQSQTRPGLVRLNSDGSIDATFVAGRTNAIAAPPARLTVDALARQPDGRILFGGVLQVGENVRTNVYRLHSDGTPDPTFQASPAHAPTIMSLLVQPDLKILVGGHFNYTNTQGIALFNGFRNLVRLSPEGVLDTSYQPPVSADIHRTFNPIFTGYVRAMALDGENRLLVAGAFEPLGLGGGFARLTEFGGRDPEFTPRQYASEGSPTIAAMAVASSGESAIAGSFGLEGARGSSIARFTQSGRMTGMAEPITKVQVSALAFQSDGKLIVGGLFDALANSSVTNLGRLHRDGSVDRSFRGTNAGPDGEITSIVVEPSGAILIGGKFTSVDSVSRRGIARLHGSGKVYRQLSNARMEGMKFAASIQTMNNKRYTLERSDSVASPVWSQVTAIDGDGRLRTMLDPSPGSAEKFYRVRIE